MILVCVGTRPELLKMAPVCALAKSRGLNVHVHCTMQSPDLVDQSILPWDSEGSLLPIIHSNPRPRLVVVQGDTRTAFETAVMAYELGLPIFYVESGVRTYDLAAPWPEEGYRQMISRIATYHACTTQHNGWNLVNEGLEKARGLNKNTLRTAMRITGSPIVESVRERVKSYEPNRTDTILVTLHRRENRGHFNDILHGVSDAGVPIIWLSHPNSWAVQENTTTLNPFPPMNATMFARLLNDVACVVTDSGGAQEESCALGVPCVVAREKTDRPESLGKGGAILAGNTRKGVRNAIVQHALVMDRSTIDRTIFGDGKASERIVDWFAEIVG